MTRALEVRRLQTENRFLRNTIEETPSLDSRSPVMRRLLETAEQAAVSDATILLMGESGTGKNVLARQIHRWSKRRELPFVVVNCTTLSEHLLESELFGHTRGAFTGAIKDKPGRLEAADGGTVFLDEIADLSLPLQTKFLRFVQEQSFERVGGEQTIKVDVRIIAASNRNLQSEVEAHHFREDFSIDLTLSRCGSLRCVSALPTFCPLPDGYCPLRRCATIDRNCACQLKPLPPSLAIVGRATSASCATPSSARQFFHKGMRSESNICPIRFSLTGHPPRPRLRRPSRD